jgi:hypothetical protein
VTLAPASRRGVSLIIAAVVLGAGCAGTPRIADGTLADAKTRVTALVTETGAAIGPRAPAVPVVPRIEKYWRSRGYKIDRSGLSDRQFPKVRAHVDTGDLIVATGYVGLPEVNLYAVSPCVK